MNKRHPYNNIIERKLEQLPAADADLLWNDMHLILDKKMPQKKEKRRFIMWFFNGYGLLLLTIVSLIIAGSSVFYLYKKEISAVTIEKLPDPPPSNKLIENGEAKISREDKENITKDRDAKENITAVSEPNQKIGVHISATATSTIADDHVSNNSFLGKQIIKQSEKYSAKDLFNQPMENSSEARGSFDIVSVDLKSIHQDFLISSNTNKEKDSLSQQPELPADKLKSRSRNNNESGFYTGIISGVDLSSVHFKSARTGSTMGLIFGYAFNDKWSIESGLLWDKKRVFDDGSYFNPKGYTPTSGITIVAVNGKTRLYEVPVNMKYTIIPGKHNLFATAGLSSYFMRLENYDYEYKQNNQPGGHNYLSYKNETKNWFSVVNFSIGYTHKLGDVGSIRIEPYLKVPIKNLGVGNMPIMSTGLNIGYTKTLR